MKKLTLVFFVLILAASVSNVVLAGGGRAQSQNPPPPPTPIQDQNPNKGQDNIVANGSCFYLLEIAGNFYQIPLPPTSCP